MNSSSKGKNIDKSFIFVLITAFCFGTMEIALKLGGGSFSALQITFLRFLIGGLFLLPFAVRDVKKKGIKITKGDIIYITILGIVGICISMTCFQLGVMNCNANTAAVIISFEILSRSSSTILAAVLLPTPGAFDIPFMSSVQTASENASGVIYERIDIAALGPTPLTDIS